jgi:deoxyribonuclease V
MGGCAVKYQEVHPWKVSIAEAVGIQGDLRGQVSLVDGFSRLSLVGGVDVSVPVGASEGHSAVVVMSFPGFDTVEIARGSRHLDFPYVPGFLSFREMPVVLEAFDHLECAPDVIIVDGQGIAHPRGLGIAAHLGLILDVPTIGCAKSHLYGYYEEPGSERGAVTPLLDRHDNLIGNVVRTRTNTKPVFISPGHKVSFESAVRIVLDCAPKYRLPEPIRAAHRSAGELSAYPAPPIE